MKSLFCHRVLLLATGLLVLTSCTGDEDADPNTIATVGDLVISFEDMEESFWLEPKYTVRTPLRLARESQLKHLIDMKHFYLAAEEVDMIEDPDLSKKLNYIARQEILKGYIHQKFLDTIKVTQDEIRDGLKRMAGMRAVENIFTRSQSEAEKLLKRLNKNSGQIGQVFTEHAEQLGWITYGYLDPVIEDAVYNLMPGQISGIIRSQYGYHILRVVASEINEDITNINHPMQIMKIRDIVRRRKAYNLISDHVESLAGSGKIAINNRLIDIMAANIQKSYSTDDSNQDFMVPPLSSADIRQMEYGLDDIRNEVIAKFGDKQITVDDYLERLREMPPFHRPYLKGHNRLIQSLIDMIRDDVLLQQALAEDYDDSEPIKRTIAKYQERLLAGEFRNRYFSRSFRENFPENWLIYDEALITIRAENEPVIDYQSLFQDVANPDSIYTSAPVQVFLKNRYVW